ncbi:glycerol kinase GlpK [Lagierella sp.]|uniref:glycerol kinase GlpK n=1 Tax=Lagierella sp. TaxID=2849657 RepID=UPI0026387FAC|nr:glycerol kinase GlpK [Lagierella sp.]
MAKYFMAIDAGTTSSRCILFTEDGQIKSIAQREIRQIFPKPGYVEQDPVDIWSTQVGCCVEAMSKVGITWKDIISIGVANQRETTILWDKKTGEPVYNAIVWQCRRTADYCDELKNKGYGDMIKEKTGLVPDAYFSATKIKWILDNVSGARERAKRGEILFGTVDSYLIWKLTGGRVHATEKSNASRTMLYNIKELKWDEDILKLLDIPREILPQVKSSAGDFGYSDKSYLGGEIPITGVLGDQQASLFGQLCFQKGDCKNTYGTGAFLLMNTGKVPVYSNHGLVTTIAWGLKDQVDYALEGSIFVAGSAVQWLRDELRILDSSEDSEYMASKVEDTNDCYVVPAFTGLGAPYWDQYARGAIVGITRGVNKYHIIRATLESIAYLSSDVIEVMEKDLKDKLHLLKVDGGASNNNFLMQFQSDILGVDVIRPQITETTALGATLISALGCGYYRDLNEIKKADLEETVFYPTMEECIRKEKIERWRKAVTYSLSWAKK